MRRAILLVICLVALVGGAQNSSPSQHSDVQGALAELSSITGLPVLRKVSFDKLGRAGLKQYLEDRIKEEVKPEEIRIDELALKRFGLVPDEFDLKSTTVDLLTEQAAAFYDYRKKKLFLLDTNGPGSDLIVVHELAHALADQHFDLGKFIKKSRNDDASLARMAVTEGQATWLMMESGARKAGQSLRTSPALADALTGSSEDMAAQYPVLAKAPLYIRASLMFPYIQGLQFQHAVVRKSGDEAFARVFKKPPATTQHIYQPDLYFAGTMPKESELPRLAQPKQWRRIAEASVGQFDHAVLIEQYISKREATDLAPHWRGGALALDEHKADKRVALLYSSEWDSPESAQRVFDAYKTVLRGKWKLFRVEDEGAASISGMGDDGWFRLVLDGTRVWSVEGLKTSADLLRQVN
jgi:hypothetical protein